MEKSSGYCFIQRAKLQQLTQVVRCILEDQSRSDLSLVMFFVHAVFYRLVHLDDIGMVQFRKNVGLFLKDSV